MKENTKAIYIETPTNPMMNVTDIRKMADIAKRHNLILIVDNTFMSPYFQNPLDLGADVVIHSGTKYLSGHNDTLAGFIVTNREDIQEKLRFLIKTTGAGLAPFDCWLVLRGMKNGAIIAEPGEFTKRAFLNGRLDLSQAEAVMDVIQAKNSMALKSSVEQLKGSVQKAIREIPCKTAASDCLY